MSYALFLLLLSPFLVVDAFSVSFISPRPLDVLDAGSTLQAQWQFLGNDSVIKIDDYGLYLCAGGNPSSANGDDTYERLMRIKVGKDLLRSSSASALIPGDVGSSHDNAYFLQLTINSNRNPLIIHSHRFGFSSMTGSFSPRIEPFLSSLSPLETAPPALPELSIFPSNAEILSTTAGSLHNRLSARQAGLPFVEQTGPIRYAPLPKLPPKKIQLRKMRRLNPTSSARIATTYLPIPEVARTTVVPSVTFSTASMQNTAAPAVEETDEAMRKFLNRWIP